MENNTQEDKQHEATSKRITDLRNKGSVMRSKDLTSGLVFIVAFIQLNYFAIKFQSGFTDNFIYTYNNIKIVLSDNYRLSDVLTHLLISNLLLLIPVFSMLLIVLLLSPFAFGGWNFTLTPVKFNFDKLNPITNLKNIYSLNLFVEVFKSLLKAIVIIGALIYYIKNNISSILNLMNFSTNTAIQASFSIISQFLVMLCLLTIFLVAVDIAYNYFRHKMKSKMTNQEVKDEAKDSDGSPLVKQKIRSRQFEILKQRLFKSVPQANVIITNPTHYSIAVRYDEKKDRAPRVLAKGKGPLAQQIRMIAISNAIPIYEAPVLARAIYHTTKIGNEVPPDLYKAVAIVLTYIQQLRNYQSGKGHIPHYTDDLEIPKELIYDE
jgi:flagellar biosynthetic protein FlhB